MISERTLSLRRYFSGITEQTFQASLGVADPPLVDYLVDLLIRFVRCDDVFGLRNLEGKRVHDVVQMMEEAEERQGTSRRKVLRHIGDFTLFWTGVYPEALKKLQGQTQRDQFVDYCNQGKRSYWMASTIPAETNEENAVLGRLSQEFELCVYGLGEVRREWERRDDSPDAPGGPWLITN